MAEDNKNEKSNKVIIVKNNKVIITLLILMILGSGGASLFLWKKEITIETLIKHKTDTLYIVKNNLEEKIKSRSEELLLFKGKNKILDKLVLEGSTRITNLEADIASLSQQNSGGEYTKEIEHKKAELNKVCRIYRDRIDVLLSQNKTIKKSNDSIATKLSKTIDEKEDLQDKVTIASEVKIEYLVITPMKKKFMSKKLEETRKAWLVRNFNTCFTVMENKLAKTGSRTLYLRIVGPDGKVVGGSALGSGTFKNAAGENIRYTNIKAFVFNGAKSNQCLDYEADPKDVFAEGAYRVEIYLDSKLSSAADIVLK
jgi:hypothetical protein